MSATVAVVVVGGGGAAVDIVAWVLLFHIRYVLISFPGCVVHAATIPLSTTSTSAVMSWGTVTILGLNQRIFLL